MKNKTPLALMEQLIMILVFALAAALCLQGFVAADQLSRRQEAISHSALLAQNMAELLKSSSGDYEEAARRFLELAPECELEINYDIENEHDEKNDSKDYQILVTPLESDTPLLGSAQIQVFFEEEMIFELTTGWQEVS